jgi:hypothetical protein
MAVVAGFGLNRRARQSSGPGIAIGMIVGGVVVIVVMIVLSVITGRPIYIACIAGIVLLVLGVQALLAHRGGAPAGRS